ncbi:retropepsin-like aspartic protease family protein [Legionella cardiaca]|uniref:Retropepsin-like aspartic protease n=1 Tax=Legionella cardiaca TaxID=1071983 RepID=A0ABY8AQ48_9GAMM|nr:retropepsin-like aspartic protease [Legionella cardiaca]WED42341.1 retropepsin-like aspartic protease [Legionella cardiaca]
MSDNHYTKAGRFMFLAVWLIFFGLLFWFFHYYQNAEQGQYQVNAGTVSVTPDPQGHYYVDGYINDHPVKFLLDTGATLVAIPENLAKKMNLRGRYAVTIKTAGGEVTGSLTRLENLSFADFKFQNIKAVIVPTDNDNVVLLGMNVLAQFDLSQKGKRLILKKS